MVEISKGHKRIKEGQEEVRERFEEISKEAAKLKEETNLISKQSAANQVRLDLMFQIAKARSENDTAMDAVLTQTLRDLMASKSKLPDEKKEQDSAP
ncbi:hypothetical protein NC651_009100 [Populus alba x Populus x berolinensis]|nr:hypothetical protein NC651_009100 [Populus alba x Populus x berolinensis]